MEKTDQLKQISIDIYISNKTIDVIVDNAIIPFKNQVTVLGLNLTTRGISSHFKTRKAILANGQLIKLNRFKSLDERIKLHIYKGMIRPILEYPVVPICLASKTNIKKKLQQTQSKALRKIWTNDPINDRTTNTFIHTSLEIEAINSRLYHLASRVWSRLDLYNNQLTELSIQYNNKRKTRDLTWWPRLGPYIMANDPNPYY